jgi:DNA-binding XRE family transcriptional regulator
MDNRHEITFGGNRRVPGLRRAEVAMLAGVSVECYTKLERGSLGGVSESVLDPRRGTPVGRGRT